MALRYDAAMVLSTVKFSFKNHTGIKLAGLIDMPAGEPIAFGIFGPCFTCVKQSNGAVKICRALAERGIAMLRFDTTGVGESEGDLGKTNFSTRIDDLLSAYAALAEIYRPPILLAGHSISGTAALTAVHHMPAIKVVATIGSPSDPQGTIAKFRESGILTESATTATINVLGRVIDFDNSFVTDMLAQKTAEDTARITQKLLIFHAPNDTIVNYKNAEIMAARNPHARLIRMAESATHLFEKGLDDANFVAEKIAREIT